MHGLDKRGQGRCRRTQLDVYDRRGGVRGDRDSVDAVEHRTDRAHVLLQRAQDRRRVPKDVDAFRGGDCEESRDGCGENERCAVDPLVIHDRTRASTEAAR